MSGATKAHRGGKRKPDAPTFDAEQMWRIYNIDTTGDRLRAAEAERLAAERRPWRVGPQMVMEWKRDVA